MLHCNVEYAILNMRTVELFVKIKRTLLIILDLYIFIFLISVDMDDSVDIDDCK